MVQSWLKIIAGALAVVMAPLAAKADLAAESFVEENARYALSVLGDETIGLEEKGRLFREFVNEVADVRFVTRYALGRYARTIDAEEFALFSEAFQEYAIGFFEARLGEFGGETLNVTGSTDLDGFDDVIVNTVISGGSLEQDIELNWRVFGGPDDHRVVDVSIAGVWLAEDQRQQVTSVIANAGGDVSAATELLRRRVQSN